MAVALSRTAPSLACRRPCLAHVRSPNVGICGSPQRRVVCAKAEAATDGATGRELVAEFVGCTLFQLIGGAAPGFVAPAANGLGLSALIYALGGVSGAHFNPAVTLMLLLRGKVSFSKAMAYMVAQVAGCVLGALICSWIIPGVVAGSGAGPGVWAPAAGLSTAAIVAWEALLTTTLCLVVFGAAVVAPGAGIAAPIAIGFAVMVAVMSGGPYSGCVINPARALGPAIVFGMNFGMVTTYIMAQALGAALASFLAGIMFSEEKQDRIEGGGVLETGA